MTGPHDRIEAGRHPDLGHRFYRRWFAWTGWEPGHTRMWRGRLVIVPRWADDVQTLAADLARRCTGRCLTCSVRGGHKMGCRTRRRLRDDLAQLAMPLRRRRALGPRRNWPGRES